MSINVVTGGSCRPLTSSGGETGRRTGLKKSHRIDPHIDRERDWVETNLFFVGTAEAYAEVDRPNALRTLSNATGDQIVTEGKISVVQLATSKRPADGPIVLKPQ